MAGRLRVPGRERVARGEEPFSPPVAPGTPGAVYTSTLTLTFDADGDEPR
jgi:hypothetical protein